MTIKVIPNKNGKYSLYINDDLINDKYTTASKACEKAQKWLKGQNR